MKRLLAPLLLLSATAASGEIYTWKDARGIEFYTNKYDEIPARYLKKARVLDVATGKKGKLATEQPPAAGQAPAQPVPAPMAGNPAGVATPVLPVSQPPVIEQSQPQPPSSRPSKRMRRGRERVRGEED